MKLSRLFLILTIISGAVFMVSFFAAPQLKLPSALSGALAGVSFVTLIVSSIVGKYAASDAGNAIVRRFGESATAKVLAVRQTNGMMVNGQGVWRVKLEVHPSGGEPFVAVAEDLFPTVFGVDEGDTVSVKYDPRTKEVALVKRKKMKKKEEDF